MHEERPFPTVFNVGEMVEGYRKLAELADSDDHIVPGHDPEVLKRYAPPSESLRGSVATLHIAPRY
jgi:glyoxylase-like metal-dependent hydrolase (beta-lactamase superfamily II)